MVLAALVAVGCDAEEPSTCATTARPRTTAVAFDANSDGVMDVADGAWHLARSLRGGEDPPCLAAVEAFGDKVDDLGTAYAIWYALISGTAVPTLAAGDCTAAPEQDAACGDGLALAVDAPATTTDTTFTATVRLSSPTLPVEAWSLSIATDGCAVTAATLEGTAAADRRDSPPGQRDGGVGMAQVSTTGGAVALVVLDPIHGTTLQGGDNAILSLTVQAPGCTTCTLSLADGQMGRGRPLTNTVSSGGRSYTPAGTGATVEVCPG